MCRQNGTKYGRKGTNSTIIGSTGTKLDTNGTDSTKGTNLDKNDAKGTNGTNSQCGLQLLMNA